MRLLALLTLCLALPPCSAQEEPAPNAPVDPPPAIEAPGVEIYDELLESALEKASALQELLDEEKISPGLRASSATMRCFDLLGDVLEVRECISMGALPESHEGVQKVNAAVKRILESTHGSDALKQALLGLEVEEALAAAGKDTDVLSDYIDDGAWFNDNCSLVVEFLQEITDKDRADKLAGPHQFRSCFHNLRLVLSARKELAESIDVDALDKWLKQLTGTPGKGAEAALREAIAACAAKEPPFFGSEKLQKLLSSLDAPFTEQEEEQEDELLQEADSSSDKEDVPARNFTPEEEQHARAMLDSRLQIYIDLRDTIASIKDKETADAAAPVLRQLKNMLIEQTEEFDEWMDVRGLPAAVNALYRAEYKPKEASAMDEAELMMSLLGLLDDMFYGSTKLKELLLGGQQYKQDRGDADTSTPEDKEEVRQTFNGFFAVTDEMRHLLLTIVDKETADAAAPRLMTLCEERGKLDKKMEEYLESNERLIAAAKAIAPEYEERIEQLNFLDSYLRTLRRQEPSYFGSEALKEALSAPRRTAEESGTDE